MTTLDDQHDSLPAGFSAAAATIQQCPVLWCDESGRHLYDDENPRLPEPIWSHSRWCTHETGTGPDDLRVAAFHSEDPEGRMLTGVELVLRGGTELCSPAAVRAYIAAIEAAAALAFGTFERSTGEPAGPVADAVEVPEPLLLDVQQVADRLGLTVWSVRHWARIGVIPSRRIGRLVRFVLADVEAAVAKLPDGGPR